MNEINLLNQLINLASNSPSNTLQNSLTNEGSFSFEEMMNQRSDEVSYNVEELALQTVQETSFAATRDQALSATTQDVAKIEAVLLPFTTYALGNLSYLSHNISSGASSQLSNHSIQSQDADLSNNGSSTRSLSANVTTNTQQYNQQLNLIASQNARSSSYQLTESYESQLQRNSYSFNADEYQLRKLTLIESEKQNLMLIRDYRLSPDQEEQIANLLNHQLSEQSPAAAKQKLIINGKTYRNN